MPFPSSLSGRVECAGISTAEANSRLLDALEQADAAPIESEPNRIGFEGAGPVAALGMNVLAALTRGEVTISSFPGGALLFWQRSRLEQSRFQ